MVSCKAIDCDFQSKHMKEGKCPRCSSELIRIKKRHVRRETAGSDLYYWSGFTNLGVEDKGRE